MDETVPKITETKIEDLGYDDFFESNRKKLGLDGFSVARVTVEYRGAYKVKNINAKIINITALFSYYV